MVDVARRPRAAYAAFTDRILVRFEGPDSGRGPLTWGQAEILNTMRATDSSMPIGGAVPVEDGRTVQDLAGELRFFMSRYASVRSRLRVGEDGEPVQEVAARGETVLGIVDVEDADDPAAAAERLAEQWRALKFDHEHEWPIRMAAIRHRGAPTHVVVVLSHFATDGVGVGTMVRELGERDPATGLARRPPTAPGPLELARQQRESAALRQNDSSLRYWKRQLREVGSGPSSTPSPGPGSGPGSGPAAPPRAHGTPRYRLATLESPALHLAARALEPGGAVAGESLLLTAFAVALSRVTGVDPRLIQIIVNNRFRPELAGVSHPLCLNGLLRAEVADLSFPQALERIRRAQLQSRKYAYYNPADLRRMRTELAAARGSEPDLGWLFNDRRTSEPLADPGPVPGPREILGALAARRLHWQPLPLFIEKLMVQVREAPPGTVVLTAEVDTRHVSPQEAEAVLLGMEAVVVEAACTAAPPAAAGADADAPSPKPTDEGEAAHG